jgi:glucan 1,3-beta-glucosidase
MVHVGTLAYSITFLPISWCHSASSHVGFDTRTFCLALGESTAHTPLEIMGHIINLKNMGVDTLRIPVGDWMYETYQPFTGCMEGALEELERGLALCRKHGINALLDLHAMTGSQIFTIVLYFVCFFILSLSQEWIGQSRKQQQCGVDC